MKFEDFLKNEFPGVELTIEKIDAGNVNEFRSNGWTCEPGDWFANDADFGQVWRENEGGFERVSNR